MRYIPGRQIRQWMSFGRNANLLLLHSVINSFGNCAFSLFFNLYILRLGFQEDFVGLLTSLPSLPAIFLAMPAGFLASRLGSKRTLALGGSGMALTLIAMCFCSSALALVMTNLFFGVVMVISNIAFFPLMMECSNEENRDAFFSAHHSAWTLAGVVGNAVMGLLPAFFASWFLFAPESVSAYRLALLTGSGLFLFALIPVLVMRPDHAAIRPVYISPTQALRKVPKWGKLVLSEVLMSFGAAMFIPFFNVFFKTRFAVSDASLGTIFALFGLITGFSALASPFVAARWGRIRSVMIVQMLSIPFMFVLGFSHFLPLVLVSYWLRGVLMSIRDPLYMAFMMEGVAEEERALMNGLLNTSWNIGWAVMPYLSGLIQVRYGFSPIFLAAAILYTLSLASLYLLFGRRRGQERAQTVSQETAVKAAGEPL